MLYLGLVEPHFRYCCSVWGSCGTVLRQKIEKFQNRAIRIITFSPYTAQTSPLLKHLKLPSIHDMIQQETVGMVYKAINNQAPEYLSVLLNRVSVTTGRTIRTVNIYLRPPRLNTTLVTIVSHTEGPCFGITCRQKQNLQNLMNHSKTN